MLFRVYAAIFAPVVTFAFFSCRPLESKTRQFFEPVVDRSLAMAACCAASPTSMPARNAGRWPLKRPSGDLLIPPAWTAAIKTIA